MKKSMEPAQPVEKGFCSLQGVLNSRTPNIESKKEREDALKELLAKRKAKAGMHRMRRGSEPDVELDDGSSIDERPLDSQRKAASRTMMNQTNRQAEVRGLDAASSCNQKHTSTVVQTPSRRRLKKLSEFSSNESARSSGEVVEIDDDSPQPGANGKSKQSVTRGGHHVEGRESPSDIVEHLRGLSIDRGGGAEVSLIFLGVHVNGFCRPFLYIQRSDLPVAEPKGFFAAIVLLSLSAFLT